MKALSPKQIAWLIPICLFIHQLEEYFGSFPAWFSELLNVELSNQDFIFINGIGLFFFIVFAFAYSIGARNNFIFSALGTLIFVNGIIHPILSIFTFSYSPGSISGLVLLIPLGIIIFKKIFPLLTKNERIAAVLSGVATLYIVNSIARNM
jgi:hypothetical protein